LDRGASRRSSSCDRCRVQLASRLDEPRREIASLGRSQRRELRSRIANIIEHLLKLEHSPAVEPRLNWIETIGRERREIERLLEDSPSLRDELALAVAAEWQRTARFVSDLLIERGELNPGTSFAFLDSGYAVEQVLGSWLPVRGSGK
jgi:Domain of unknown function DUF29